MNRSFIYWLLFQSFPAGLVAANAQEADAASTDTTETRVGWFAGPSSRGTLTLLYSCLMTVFACTWTVLHLNVPAVEDSGPTRLLRKAKWMAITILLPEFIFSKAVCELQLALKDLHEFDKTLRERYNTGLDCELSYTADQVEHRIIQRWEVEYSSAVRYLLWWTSFMRDSTRSPIHWLLRVKDFMKEISRLLVENIGAKSDIASDHPDKATDNLDAKGQEDSDLRVMRKKQYWTISHAYLANMGGLVYTEPYGWHNNESHCSILTGAQLDCDHFWHEDAHPLQRLVLSQDDIADKSKADAFLKVFSVLQILWLILTIIARRASELPLTQLELTTLAFSVLAIATYLANWWKPKDISQPIRLLAEQRNLNHSCERCGQFQSFCQRLRYPERARRNSQHFWLHNSVRVPNDKVEMGSRDPAMFRYMAMSAFVFGGIHCLAWNFSFPSQAETILWRTASIASALLPTIPLTIDSLSNEPPSTDIRVSLAIAGLKLADANTTLERLMVRFVTLLNSSNQPRISESIQEFCGILSLLPCGYKEMLKNPHFGTWTKSQLAIMVSKSVGKHRFLDKPSEQDVLPPGLDWMDQVALGQKVRGFHLCFKSFIEELEAAAKEKKQDAMEDLSRLYHQMKSCYDSEAVKIIIKDYEDSFINSGFLPSGRDELSSKFTVVEATLELGEVFLSNTKHASYVRTLPDTGSIARSMVLFIGVLYVTARLIILVLMFTSLREVPVSVYEQTPWTRFLPDFS